MVLVLQALFGNFLDKVENISKGSLDSIPSLSPSVKNSNYGQESFLEV